MPGATQQQAQTAYENIDPLDVGATPIPSNPLVDPNAEFTSGKAKNSKSSGTKASTFPTQAQELINTVPQAPSTQQDINQILGPYIQQLMQLGPEYQQEMEYLKPYLSPEYNGSQGQPATYTGPGADVVNKDQAALGQSEQALGSSIENQPAPGFGNVASQMQQYANSIPYEQALQAGLGYQKYLETYGGLGANTSAWPQQLQEAYKAIGSGSGGTSGLPGITKASAGQNANNLLNTATNAASGSGSTSSG
jgi:hypothetical protein